MRDIYFFLAQQFTRKYTLDLWFPHWHSRFYRPRWCEEGDCDFPTWIVSPSSGSFSLSFPLLIRNESLVHRCKTSWLMPTFLWFPSRLLVFPRVSSFRMMYLQFEKLSSWTGIEGVRVHAGFLTAWAPPTASELAGIPKNLTRHLLDGSLSPIRCWKGSKINCPVIQAMKLSLQATLLEVSNCLLSAYKYCDLYIQERFQALQQLPWKKTFPLCKCCFRIWI